jgi:hypothetical protein
MDEETARHRSPEMGSLTDAQVEQVVTFGAMGWYSGDDPLRHADELIEVRCVADAWADPDCTWLMRGNDLDMPREWLDECITGWYGPAEQWLLEGLPTP